MNILVKLFIGVLFEQQAGIPRRLTIKVLEALEHSDAIKNLFAEVGEAQRSGYMEVKHSIIDEAFEEMERLVEIQIESENVSEEKKRELKIKNKADGQLVRKMFCDSLLHDGFRIK